MRRIDPPRRVFDDRKDRRRKKSRNHDDDFDLEYEKPPSDWREKVAQRSIGNTKLGAFQVTIRNSKEDDEEENITREISTSVTKNLIKDPIKVKSTGPIKKFQKIKTAISQDSDESDDEEERRRKEKERVEQENLREATKASKAESVIHCSDYLFSHEDLEDLEDFNLPKDALQLAKMARFGRDRDGRNVLSILLDWKNVKAFVKDFSEKSFQPIVQSLTLLIAAGADPMVADRLGKCCGHYLAEWRYTKERVDDHMHLQLPKRVKEILEELGFIELQCYKPNPLMKQQPSLLFPRDEDKNTFLHLLVKSNYKRNPVYKQENHCLFRAMQALLVSMKIPNVLWGMAGRDKTDLRSLFQQPGLFMEQNFNRIRAATQSPEIDEFFKKIPKNAVTKYSGRPSEKSSSDVPSSDTKPKPDPEKNLDYHLSQSSNKSSRSGGRDDRGERHREDRNKDRSKDRTERRNGRSRKSKSPKKKPARARSSDSSRSSSPSDSEKYSGRQVQVIKKKDRSPTPKKKSRSPSPIIIKRSEKRKNDKKSPEKSKTEKSISSSSRSRRRRRSSSPEVRKRSLTPKKRKKSESPDPLRDEPKNMISLDEEYLTDNDEVYDQEKGDERKFTLNLQNDMLEVGISADDFIDDAIAMLPNSRPSSKRDRTDSLKSHSRKRSTSHSPKRKKSSKRSPTPKKNSPVKEVSSKSSRSRDEKSRSERSRENKSRDDKTQKSRDRRKEEEPKRDDRVNDRGSNDSRVRESDRDKSRKSRSRDRGSRERDKRKRETKDVRIPAPVPKPTDNTNSSRRRRRSSESPEPQRKSPKRNDNRSRSPLRNFEKSNRKESRRESSPPEAYKVNRKSPIRKSPIRKSPSRSERRDRLEIRDDRRNERKRNDDSRRRRTRSRSRDRKQINSRERPEKKSEDRNRRDRSDNRDKRERSTERKDDSQKWMRLANY